MKRLSIVVPYRDRAEHLRRFVTALSTYFSRDKLDCQVPYRVLVVQQSTERPFNRGALNNIGFRLSCEYSDYVCFHDVDYLPVWADYSWSDTPTALAWHGLERRPIVPGASGPSVDHDPEKFFGAVTLTPNFQFAQADGYSNLYWGWGYEDDDLVRRYEAKGIAFRRRRGTYQPLDHVSLGFRPNGMPSEASLANQRLFAAQWAIDADRSADGLSTLQFETLQRENLAIGTSEREALWEIVTVRLPAITAHGVDAPPPDPLQYGARAHREGDFAAAARAAAAVLRRQPNRFDALMLWAVAHASARHWSEALIGFERALSLRPDSAQAHAHRGATLLLLGRPRDAMAAAELAIAARPDFGEAHANRGVALAELGRIQDALAAYDRALTLQPENAANHYNRANTLQAAERLPEALAGYERALALRPGYSSAATNRAATLMKMRRREEAWQTFSDQVEVAPYDVQARCNLAVALNELSRFKQGASAAAAAMELQPDCAEARFAYANALFGLRRYEEALAAYEATARLAPNHPTALERAAASALHLCDPSRWRSYAEALRSAVETDRCDVAPFTFLAYCDDPALQRRCAENHMRRKPAVRPGIPHAVRRPGKIRLGYVSADFQRHPLASLLPGLLAHHDREKFELHGICLGADDGEAERRRFVATFDAFHDASAASDAETAEMIRQLDIDVAFDLNGHTFGGRPQVFARRSARLQISYLGYPGTLGAACWDYAIADAVVAPSGAEMHFSEKILRLPRLYQPNARREFGPQPSRDATGLSQGTFVFASLGASWKISPEVFEVWLRLLARVPNSALWLLVEDSNARSGLQKEALRSGIDPARLVFAPRLAPSDHLARLPLADLALDTYPYGAHTTASDCLAAGVPIVTLCGRSFPARVASSLLRTCSLDCLIARNFSEYEETAVAFASGLMPFSQIREHLAISASPIFDGAAYAREFDAEIERLTYFVSD